jgi:uncharacterized protein YidB (DUF937 family)
MHMMPIARAWPAIAVLVWPLWPAVAQSPALPTAPSTEQTEALQRWRELNERVGEFPRGHIDLLQWERRQSATAAAAPPEPVDVVPLGMDKAVQTALALQPHLFNPPALNPLVERARHQALIAAVVQTRQSWLDAVLATQMARHQLARSELADNGAELGRRMVQAGNWSRARWMREQITQTREQSALRQARQTERMAHEQLARQLGITRAEEVNRLAQRLPTELVAPPAKVETIDLDEVAARVLAADASLAPLRMQAAQLQRAVSADRLQAHADTRQRLASTLPEGALPTQALVLDDVRIGRDHALAEAAEAVASLQRAEVERRSQAREAWGRLLDQHALAQQTGTVLLPLVSAQEQETQLRYNGMLQSTWELFDAGRERLAATTAAAQARHAYWTALLDWQLLLAGGPYRATDTSAPSAQAGTAAKDH